MTQIIGVVLAAGFGKRLRPSTDACPKPLIPVAGIEALFFSLYQFHRLGIQRVVVNAHHLAEQIENILPLFEKLLPGMQCRLSVEHPQILGSGGALVKIVQEQRDWCTGAALLVKNGDTFGHMDLKKLMADQSPTTNYFATSCLHEHLQKYSALWLKEREFVGVGAQRGGSLAHHFLGSYFLKPRAVALLQDVALFEVTALELFSDIWQTLRAQGQKFIALQYFTQAGKEDFWFDLTNVAFVLEAQKEIFAHSQRHPLWGEVLRARYPKIKEVGPAFWLHTTQEVEKIQRNTKIKAPAVWIEHESSGQDLVVGDLELGPEVTLVHRSGALRFQAGAPKLSLNESTCVVQHAVQFSENRKINKDVFVF